MICLSMIRTIRYYSSRVDVWRWYWQAWRTKFWRLHVLLAAFLVFVLPGAHFNDAGAWALRFTIALVAVTLLMAAVPQVLFKSAKRTLHVGPEGWSTQVGTVSGSARWCEVASIQERDGAILIESVNGNALIVPSRAFSDAATRQQFLSDIRQWHTQHDL
jgi:hypothetical protein